MSLVWAAPKYTRSAEHQMAHLAGGRMSGRVALSADRQMSLPVEGIESGLVKLNAEGPRGAKRAQKEELALLT